jgi:hypothetical protein
LNPKLQILILNAELPICSFEGTSIYLAFQGLNTDMRRKAKFELQSFKNISETESAKAQRSLDKGFS